ncbi:MAG: hypothetical protein KKG47_01895 [Proteobacteria bacterium]|nr:hypothetical protein [Pseudomonadota bacterium]MBU1737329.1 hypothetical protein [Pseudomonadota bacterium]
MKNSSGETNPGFTPFTSILSQHEGERVYASVDPGKLKRDAEEQARISAAEIVSKGKAEAGETRQKAYDEGFARGREEGLAAVRREHDAMLVRLRELMQEIEARCAGAVDLFAEQEVLELVKVMVERLVNHEVSVNPRVIRATLIKALSYVVENSEVRVSLNPDDFNRLKEAGLEEAVLLEGLSRIQLMEDHAIEAGGCLLNTDYGEIDATLANRRQKLYQAVDRAFMSALAKDVPPEDDGGKEEGRR